MNRCASDFADPATRARVIRKVLRITQHSCVAGPMNTAATRSLVRVDGARFVSRLSDAVRAHHSHSRLLVEEVSQTQTGRAVKMQKAPAMRFDPRTNVGTVRLFTYVMAPGEHWTFRPEWVKRCRDRLAAWTARGCRGLIVDLRRHHGGSYRPGLDAIGAELFRDQALFEWVDPRGKSTVEFYDGQRQRSARSTTSTVADMPFPVAVLIGEGTASSGEILASAFVGKRGARTFGAATAGGLSVNEGFDVHRSAACRVELLLTVRRVRTSDGVLHTSERLTPDVITNDPEGAARSWILSSSKRADAARTLKASPR